MKNLKIKLENLKKRNPMAKEVLSPKYRMRVMQSEKLYNRKNETATIRKELSYG